MIPIKLELEAFGPFVARQVIDFTEFQNDRLFLITGNTGSGKTTIFDAISFSLYGQASGCVRQSDSFKSNFSDANTVCYTSFTFIIRGKYYVVRREPIQIRLKRGGKLVRENSTATITLEDGTIIAGTANVDIYIEKLLGLNAEQFKKIVMLPQGEFRRFLSDDGNEKQKILRKIFNTKLLDDFTEQLRINVAKIKSEIDQLNTGCNVIIETVSSLNNIEIENQKQAEYADFAYMITLLVEHNKATLEVASEKKLLLDTLNEQRKALNLPYYKEINNNFAILDKLKLELASLNTCHEQFVAMKAQIIKLQGAQTILPTYNTKCRLIAEINSLKAKITQYQQKITEFKATAENYSLLIQLSEKLASVSEQIKLDQSIIENLKQYKKLVDTFLLHKKTYQHTFHSFINGQAFLLSVTLKDNSPCPVCGSLEHPNPALDNGETITKSQLDLAKSKYESSTQQVESLIAKCKQLISQKQFSAAFNDLKDYTPLVKEDYNLLILDYNQIQLNIKQLNISKELMKSPSQQQLNKLNAQLERGIEAIHQNSNMLLELEEKLVIATLQFEQALSENFLSEQEFIQLTSNIETIPILAKKINDHNNAITIKTEQISALTLQLKDKSPVNLSVLQEQSECYTLQIESLETEHISLCSALSTNKNCLERLKKNHELLLNQTKIHADINKLFDVANGKFSDKLNFERYVLAAYFDSVINNANLRLEEMTNLRYTLIRREQKEKWNKASGLSLDVFDAYNGKSRHVNTLSGGESFKVALSLALGLADIISQNSGGIELNTMFIDEGFGSLDSDSLDSAIDCLYRIKLNGRYIGIISHVNELKEKISAKIVIEQHPTGSTILSI